MSILLGLEIAGAAVRLVVVDRQAKVVARSEEPLATPAVRWWETHPDERVRATIGLLSAAVADGAFRPAQVAAIGITADPALALLDADLLPIPARDLPWGTLDPSSFEGRPWDALAALFEASPQVMMRIGAVLDLVGFIRYRLSGALAAQVDFAWQGGHIVSPKSPASWNSSSLDEIGLLPSHLPPIFPATQRVSVVGEETIEKTGLRRGTWVSGGGSPRNTRILFAAEPTVGRRVIEIEGGRATLWEAVETPERWEDSVIPTAIDGVFFRSQEELELEAIRRGDVPEGVVIDWPAGEEVDLDSAPEDLLVAADAGLASAGTAIVAGIGLGWWRDHRPIWRKRRPPRTLGALRAERQEVDSGADPTDEGAEAPDA